MTAFLSWPWNQGCVLRLYCNFFTNAGIDEAGHGRFRERFRDPPSAFAKAIASQALAGGG
jgi:hypothetical protein